MDMKKLIEKTTPYGILGVKISQNGNLVGEHLWEEDCRRNIYSASKSFTSCAVGIAQSEGLLSIDEKLVDAFAGDLPEEVGENLAKATVRDLLTMCLGQAEGFLMGGQRVWMEEEDWVKASLAVPFAYAPGEKFVYNNVGPYLAGILVQRRAGCDLVEYLMPRLYTPLGIRRPTWEVDPLGNTFGAGGLMLTLDELHRFGRLYLQNGMWNGKQLVPEDWVRESTTKQVENGAHGYGYLFWAGERGSFRADGKYHQYSILLRDRNAVVSCLAECRKDGFRQVLIDETIAYLDGREE
ncbi:MAG: serine hydrolase [Clostridia bacterium]|nr:serine hydrolase [Clostridia bacterium]